MEWQLNPHISKVINSKTGEQVAVDWSRPVGLHDGSPVTIEYDLATIAETGHLKSS